MNDGGRRMIERGGPGADRGSDYAFPPVAHEFETSLLGELC